ncbi:HNH endonuclease [Tsukamurella pulmonis]|uniref:HNH endonuclease n=1 Tax=Tsukamurella pulmonis TaxID=47312 RepID=A0A1H1E185_9ACTN|nr:HNH endonuclease [Tsukamurella pulmonis]KXO92119.1 HNH endonuclease [Tsukamurella pulmonis]SDQ82477.1 HNH endonuclease [Tsukamurella pulmonis]SUP21426.1 HNH endonuclease [Tsukamurella pulmonis]
MPPKSTPPARTRKARIARRRARRVAAADNDLTGAQWEELLRLWGACAYCGGEGPFQKDCVLPISRGGRYTRDNVVPACRSCNASKCNAEVTGWMRRKKLDEKAFLQGHAEILMHLRLRDDDGAPTGEVGAPSAS